MNGREYVSLRSFCNFYGFSYQVPNGSERFSTRSPGHSLNLKLGNSDLYIDGVHYVMSFPIEGSEHDWLVSRMDVIKLFDPVLRPREISGRHSIRGVVIDAGHGGSDNGATSRYGSEKNYTRDTAFRLETLMKNAGLKTVLTRRTDVFVDLYERAHIASLYPDYAFVSIHFNSATEEAHGLETYCLAPRGAASTSSAYLTRSDIQKLPGNDFDTQNILLASMVHSEIIKLNSGDSSADRGVKRARFVVIKQNVLPAILVEGGFVSNHSESKRVDDPQYRQRLAEAIARGVIRFVNAMGDRNLSLPGTDDEAAPPKAAVVAPPTAPSGLARDGNANNAPAPKSSSSGKTSSGKGTSKATAAATPAATGAEKTTGLTPATNGTPKTASSTGSKSKKKKKVSVSTTLVDAPGATTSTNQADPPSLKTATNTAPPSPPAPAVSPSTNDETADKAKPDKSDAALNLSEPTPPPSGTVSDKNSAEPDEPPTVNIYPTNSGKPASHDDAPASSSPAPASTGTSTNAAPANP